MRTSEEAALTPNLLYAELDDGQEVQFYNLAADPYQLRSRHADPATVRERRILAYQLKLLKSGAGANCRLLEDQ